MLWQRLASFFTWSRLKASCCLSRLNRACRSSWIICITSDRPDRLRTPKLKPGPDGRRFQTCETTYKKNLVFSHLAWILEPVFIDTMSKNRPIKETRVLMELRVYWKYCEFYFRIEYSWVLTYSFKVTTFLIPLAAGKMSICCLHGLRNILLGSFSALRLSWQHLWFLWRCHDGVKTSWHIQRAFSLQIQSLNICTRSHVQYQHLLSVICIYSTWMLSCYRF